MKIKYQINHDEWTFKIVSDEAFLLSHGKKYHDSEAITIFNNKTVELKECFSIEILRHELMHIHYKNCWTESMRSLKLDDQEELFCDLFGYRGPLMIKQAKELFKLLTSYQK